MEEQCSYFQNIVVVGGYGIQKEVRTALTDISQHKQRGQEVYSSQDLWQDQTLIECMYNKTTTTKIL